MVVLNKQIPKEASASADVSSYKSTHIAHTGRLGGSPWMRYGVVALATTSSLLSGRTSGQPTPFAGFNPSELANHQRLGRLRDLPTSLKPGHFSLDSMTNNHVPKTFPPAFIVEPASWYGSSALEQANSAAFDGRPPGSGFNTPSFETNSAFDKSTASQSLQNLTISKLQGCGGNGYAASVNIEGQNFLVLADTGSFSLGIASNNCTNCDNIHPTYEPGKLSRSEGKSVEMDYGSGSFMGELRNAPVSFAGGSSLNVGFAAIYNQTKLIYDNFCNLTAQSLGISPGPPFNHGIMGLAGAGRLTPGTDSWVAKANYPTITFGLCDRNGVIYLGGYPANKANSSFVFTPMALPVENGAFISVAVQDMSVGQTKLGANMSTFGAAIVDTGTSALILPNSIYSLVVSHISDATGGAVNQNFFDTGQCQIAKRPVSDLNVTWPSLTFHFYNLTKSSSYTTPGMSSYIEVADDGKNGSIVCPRMANSGDNGITILGNAIMRNSLTIIDYKEQLVGFATSKGICK